MNLPGLILIKELLILIRYVKRLVPPWRNSGIAGLLMEALIRSARTRGLKRMESSVLRTNTAMLRFARGLGFEVRTIEGDLTAVSIVKPL